MPEIGPEAKTCVERGTTLWELPRRKDEPQFCYTFSQGLAFHERDSPVRKGFVHNRRELHTDTVMLDACKVLTKKLRAGIKVAPSVFMESSARALQKPHGMARPRESTITHTPDARCSSFKKLLSHCDDY